MRAFLVVVVLTGLGLLFLIQKQHSRAERTEAPRATQVSEHNWAKHALDKTSAVAAQARQHRQANGQR